MTREEFLAKEAAGEAVLVDIREQFELATEPSPARAVNLPLSRLLEGEGLASLPEDKQIVTLCQSGGRCGVANTYLAAHGFAVDMIDFGLTGWMYR